MATNTLRSIPHHHNPTRQRVESRAAAATTIPSSYFLQTTPINNPSISVSSNSISFTPLSYLSTAGATSSIAETAGATTFDALETHLAAQDFRRADEETRRLIIALAGEAAVKRGYVFFSEVQFIPTSDLQTIDNLWKTYSNNKFGYSVQRKIWRKCNKDFTRFFIKVGWMKKLDTEVVQYNYRAFPDEFIWELGDDSPSEGHLPLTNALRGTQLLSCILNHPAFENGDDEDEDDKFDGGGVYTKPLSKSTGFKTDYSF